MPLPFAMTLAGSIPLVLCILLWLLQTSNFDVFLGIRFLKLSMFFYLVPVQLIFHILPEPVYRFLFSWKEDKPFDKPIRTYYEGEMIISCKEQYIWIPAWVCILFLCWMICVLLFAALQMKSYRKLIKSLSIPDKTNTKKMSFQVLKSNNSFSPFSVGFIKNYIVFPTKEDYEPEDRNFIYKHELCHINNHDVWMKLLCLVIICIHFYNPFVYILLVMYGILSEYACDSYAVENLSDIQRKRYARLLVELSCTDAPLPIVWKNSFSFTKFNLKRRILYIMKKNGMSKLSKRFTVITLSILSVFICTSTILAYEPAKSTAWNPKTEIPENGFIEFAPMDCKTGLNQYTFLDFSKSNVLWCPENGEQTPILSDEVKVQKNCFHSYEPGMLFYHTRNGSGGCTINQYTVSRCSKCGAEKNKTFYTSFSFTVCPH